MNNSRIFCPRFNYVIEFNWKTNQNIDKHATSPKKEDEWGPYLYTDLYIYGKYIVIKRTDTILFRKICEIGDHSRQWIFKKQWRSHFFNHTHTQMLEKITPDDICIEFIYFFGISKFRQEGFSLIRERGPRSRAMTTTLIIGWLSGPPIDRIWSILQSQSAWSGEKIFGAGIVKFFQWTGEL